MSFNLFHFFRELVNTLKYKSALCDDLESQLAKVIEKNTQLTIANNDLQKKVVELQDVSEECATLKFTLEKVETDYTNAKSEVNNLNGKVRNLESVLDEMHKAADNRREIGKPIVILKKAQWAKFFKKLLFRDASCIILCFCFLKLRLINEIISNFLEEILNERTFRVLGFF